MGDPKSEKSTRKFSELFVNISKSLYSEAYSIHTGAKKRRGEAKFLKDLDAKHSAITNPSAHALDSIAKSMNAIANKDKKGLLGHAWGFATGTIDILIVKPAKIIAVSAASVAILTTSLTLNDYIKDDDKDILDIPNDVSIWLKEQPSLNENVIEPLHDCTHKDGVTNKVLCTANLAIDTVSEIPIKHYDSFPAP